MVELTQENYYQDKTFMSVSRFKQYDRCEAMALAIEKGEWIDQRDDKALLFGNYVHSACESGEAHEAFKLENKARLFSSRKPHGLLKDFELAEVVVQRLKSDECFQPLYDGKAGQDVRKEMIVTGEIGGVVFKSKLDSVNMTSGYFVDLKTARKVVEAEWSPVFRKHVPAIMNNIYNFGYHIQLAVYRELLFQMTGRYFTPLIVAVSKENVPVIKTIRVEEKWLSEGLEYVSERVGRVSDVIAGKTEPKMCGVCDFCKSKTTLDKIWTLDDLLELY